MIQPDYSQASVPEIFSAVRCLSQREHRLSSGRVWLEGVKHFIQAHDSRQTFDAVIYSRILLKSDLAEMLVRRLVKQGVRRIRVTPEQFRSISLTTRASGIGAVIRQRWTLLCDVVPQPQRVWLIVEEIRSRGNFGTILRTAEATGVAGVILVGPACDPYDPVIMRASMGGIFHLPLIRTTHDELGMWAARHHVNLVGLTPEAPLLWSELSCDRPVGLIIGEERNGLSPALRELCHTLVRLPMTGRADSLNVGIATGVMLYELFRKSSAISPLVSTG